MDFFPPDSTVDLSDSISSEAFASFYTAAFRLGFPHTSPQTKQLNQPTQPEQLQSAKSNNSQQLSWKSELEIHTWRPQ